jgi:ribosomal protein S18 acetylase RimI-like enzyme
MAAVSVANMPRLVHLRELRGNPLGGLLGEEVDVWRRELDWNFQPSADLVSRYTGMQALNGFALLYGQAIAGYTYFVSEEHKGLIGDLYVREEHRLPDSESHLLAAAVRALMESAYIRRIECQLMLARTLSRNRLPEPRHLQYFPRLFLMADLSHIERLPAGRATEHFAFELWQDKRQEESASVITSSYHGHIDSQINDQYRTTGGARRFLHNIIQYPGCGTFTPASSFVAVDPSTGRLCGVCLASLVALGSGHVTQICVPPAYQAKGVGYELLRRSMLNLRHEGAKTASLTVTAENKSAVDLYERMGFRRRREFSACVWEGF